MLPETVVDWLFEPTVSDLLPNKYRPSPAIDPAVRPPEDNGEISNCPVPLVVTVALPAVLESAK
jgi:hypothetical protein